HGLLVADDQLGLLPLGDPKLWPGQDLGVGVVLDQVIGDVGDREPEGVDREHTELVPGERARRERGAEVRGPARRRSGCGRGIIRVEQADLSTLSVVIWISSTSTTTSASCLSFCSMIRSAMATLSAVSLTVIEFSALLG